MNASQTTLLKCHLQHGTPSITLGKLLLCALVSSTVKTGEIIVLTKQRFVLAMVHTKYSRNIVSPYVSRTDEILKFKGA